MTEVSASRCCHEEWSPQQHKGSVQAKIIDLGTGLFSCWEIHCLQRKRCRHSQQQEATDRKIPLPLKGLLGAGPQPQSIRGPGSQGGENMEASVEEGCVHMCGASQHVDSQCVGWSACLCCPHTSLWCALGPRATIRGQPRCHGRFVR